VAGVKVPPFQAALVELTRLCPARCRSRDGDNLQASAKAVRDEVAALLGVDDADLNGGKVSWSYRQLPNQRHMVKIRVTLVPDLSTATAA
jgi:hypothetical protein